MSRFPILLPNSRRLLPPASSPARRARSGTRGPRCRPSSRWLRRAGPASGSAARGAAGPPSLREVKPKQGNYQRKLASKALMPEHSTLTVGSLASPQFSINMYSPNQAGLFPGHFLFPFSQGMVMAILVSLSTTTLADWILAGQKLFVKFLSVPSTILCD